MKDKDSDCIIVKNRYWSGCRPFLTVITPVFNRRSTIRRAIDSVEGQTFRDIEYIIIDDGSSESIDDVVKKFMNSTNLPVMFIKKPNGGVHTARNVGYRNARGELVLCLDSDDELLPDACSIMYKTWFSIPKEQREEYWEIKAQCVDQNGNNTASMFPDGINDLDKEIARKYFSLAKGEQIGCRVTKIMRDNLFPEPKGVTFVVENIRWVPLEKQYRSYGINDVVRIYHREGDDHLSSSKKKKSRQDLRNLIWNFAYQLNNQSVFGYGFIMRLKMIGKYNVFSTLLRNCGDVDFVSENELKGFFNQFWGTMLRVPSRIIAYRYSKH